MSSHSPLVEFALPDVVSVDLFVACKLLVYPWGFSAGMLGDRNEVSQLSILKAQLS